MGLLDVLFGPARHRELLITDVTWMQGDRVCVAGVCGRDTVRLAEPAPTAQLLESLGGLVPGHVVRVRWDRVQRYRPPHQEDCRWRPGSLEHDSSLTLAELYTRLSATAFHSVTEAFGKPKYLTKKGNPAFPADKGKRSLASINATHVKVYRAGDGLRADFSDSASEWQMLPVESIALRNHFEACAECAKTGARAAAAVLRVGLGRPFQPDGDELGCFAQVNCVIPADPESSHFI